MRSKWMLVVVLMFGINLGIAISAYAQGTPAASGGGWLAMVLPMIPMIWQSVAPLATAWVTKMVNEASIHVPREFQVIIVGLLGALGAGFASSMDPVVTGATALGGAVSQFYAGASSKTLRTEPTL